MFSPINIVGELLFKIQCVALALSSRLRRVDATNECADENLSPVKPTVMHTQPFGLQISDFRLVNLWFNYSLEFI
jgi:hypothetical protein